MWDAVIIILTTLIIALVITILWTDLVGAPWVPTPMKRVHYMLTLAEVGPDDLIYDLGCGDGRLVITAARQYAARAVGIEIDPLRYVWCRLMVTLWGVQERVTIIYGNFFDQDLSTASVVTCFLRQRTNNKLEEIMLAELRPGTRVVSNTFIFPTIPAVGGDEKVRLYLFY
jgi:hypothetical protein